MLHWKNSFLCLILNTWISFPHHLADLTLCIPAGPPLSPTIYLIVQLFKTEQTPFSYWRKVGLWGSIA